MIIEHIAIWIDQLEEPKDCYSTYFNGKPNEKYINHTNKFESYFLSFTSGARQELMYMPDIPENRNDRVTKQHKGIIHLAFRVKEQYIVDEKIRRLKEAGIRILRGLRATGDGYYKFETLDPE